MYIRQVEQVPGVAYDARMYDHGRLELAVSGGGAGVVYVCGELWVTYDIILYKPRLGRLSAGLFVDPPPVPEPFPPPEDIHVPEDPTFCCRPDEKEDEEEKKDCDPPSAAMDAICKEFAAYKLAHP
jgi:hypothetical protein